MRQRLINGRWNIWTTDAIADWDALSGDPSVPSGWECERFTSMQQTLSYGDVLYDIGTEHGALSTVIAREFVGPENMVLMEPSPQFWPNIRKHWRYNGLADPAGFWSGFVGPSDSPGVDSAMFKSWPSDGTEPEVGGMPYASLVSPGKIPMVMVDTFAMSTPPRALNIDVEGAEYGVLLGARATMNALSPHIWISIHPDLLERDFGSSKDQVLDLLVAHGYDPVHLGTDHEEHWFCRGQR